MEKPAVQIWIKPWPRQARPKTKWARRPETDEEPRRASFMANMPRTFRPFGRPTGPEMSVCCSCCCCGCCIVLWLLAAVALGAAIWVFIFCASAFPFYFCRHLALTIGQGVLPVCFLCSRHVLVLLKNISTYALCERVCVLCIVVVQ